MIFSNRLGDTIMSLPFIRGIKQHFPENKIHAVVNEGLMEWMNLIPEIDGVLPKTRKKSNSLFNNIATAKNIRKAGKFDLCFCLSDSFSTALIAFLSQIKIRIGHKTDGRSFLLTHSYTYSVERDHNTKYSMNLLEKYLRKKIEIKPYNIELKEKGGISLPEGTNLVFNINSLEKSRILPIWKAKEIISGIQQKYHFNIILIGTPNEKRSIDILINQLTVNKNVYNYAGKTTLVGLTYLLNESDVVISTDTGTAHLANMLGVKLIVLFGAGDYRKTRPQNPNNLIILNKHLPCSPCLKAECKFGEPICLTQIENVEIFNAIDKLLIE